jgi:hypothetical protein
VADSSRRAFIGGGLAVLGAAALPLCARGSLRSAIPARQFADAIGICTHPNWRTPLWGSSGWQDLFLQTGVGHTRGKIGRGSPERSGLTGLQPLFARNVKICVTIADQTDGLDRVGTKANLDFLADVVGAHNVSAIESANEYNNPKSRPPNWAVELRDFQKWLHDTVRADRRFDNVPLVGPSIWGRLTDDYRALGNIAAEVDKGCIHYYTGGRRPTLAGRPQRRSEGGGPDTYGMADAIGEARILAPSRPMWMTEFGYAIAGPGLPQSDYFITEFAAAKYLLRGLLDAFGEGVEKIYIYSLLDDVGRSTPRYHGLADGNLRPRQTFEAVRNLMALFADRAGPFRTGELDFSIANGGSGIKQQLFQTTDGAFLLTMYRDVDSYDRTAMRDIAVEPLPVVLKLAQPASRIEVFTPTMSNRPAQRVANAATLTVSVADEVTVVRVTPRA